MPLPVVVMVSLGKDIYAAAVETFLEGNARGFSASLIGLALKCPTLKR